MRSHGDDAHTPETLIRLSASASLSLDSWTICSASPTPCGCWRWRPRRASGVQSKTTHDKLATARCNLSSGEDDVATSTDATNIFREMDKWTTKAKIYDRWQRVVQG